MPSFSPTPTAEISLKSLRKGESLFLQGEQVFGIFVVQRGRVRLLRHLSDGTTVPLHIAHDGETFSEAALFSKVYHCDAIADIDSEIEIHPKNALSKALDEDPHATREFMGHLARQVITLRSRLEIRNIRSAKERIIQFLKLSVDETDMKIIFTRPLKDIAADIGLTHEVFYRTLSDLERSGKISRDNRTIAILNNA